MKFDVINMKGRFPRTYDRNLSPSTATVAENTDLRSSAIRPYFGREQVKELTEIGGDGVDTIYRWDNQFKQYWLRFPGDIDVVRSPVADDVWRRVYWTGDPSNLPPFNEPRFSYDGEIQGANPAAGDERYPINTFKIGVPPPDAFPTATIEAAKGGTIADITFGNGFVVETSSPHNMADDDLIEVSINSGPVGADQQDIAERLNDTQHQVAVVSDTELRLVNTTVDANINYSDFANGTWSQYTGDDFKTERRYIFTYVNDLGEEGPPQDDIDEQDPVKPTPFQDVTLQFPSPSSDATNGRVLANRRIYRVSTGTQRAQFQFLAEVDINTNTFTDSEQQEVAESIPSTTWDPPNNRMQGLRVAPQGYAVGFFDNVVAFSEPNRLHAWPTNYQIAVDWPIVAIEVIDAGVVVATEGRPYLIQGVEPRSMTPRQLWVTEACVSKRSMTTLGYAALYASVNGLVMVSQNGAELVTRHIVTEKEWSEFKPETMHANEFSQQYVGFYGDSVSGDGVLFDPKEPERGLVDVGFWCKDTFRDATDAFLYLLLDDNTIVRWDSGEPNPCRWGSKRFTTPYPVNMGAVKITADGSPVTFRLYAAGAEVFSGTVPPNVPMALPSGYKAREFQFEVESTVDIRRIEVAESHQELDLG